MFEPCASCRADMKAGVLYAVSGEQNWIYYGQVTPDKRIGFFRRRDRDLAEPGEVVIAPVMAVIGVGYPSITGALRSGIWRKLGRFDLVGALMEPWPLVQWPVGTLQVTVCEDGREYDTHVDDPLIQRMEIIASWDAELHIPKRLTADFGEEESEWHVGGPIWRERRVMEERARRFPNTPGNELPPHWVWTDVR